MKEFKGTQYPWKAEPECSNSIIIVNEEQSEVCGITADNDEDLLTELEWYNARVLAAAPELLETLQELREYICSLKITDETSALAEKSRLVILKALGE